MVETDFEVLRDGRHSTFQESREEEPGHEDEGYH